jgi:hypothetical protein
MAAIVALPDGTAEIHENRTEHLNFLGFIEGRYTNTIGSCTVNSRSPSQGITAS